MAGLPISVSVAHAVSIKYAKIHLSNLIDRAMRGEDMIICRGSIPLVGLVPIIPPKPKKKSTPC
jgi:antitoxin (DNA-binding transcriptional repressor) of toxin-antitoxin stability system